MTGPPSLLAPCSVTEVGHCWAQRPAVFAAPALEPCPEKRALLVLRWFLIALRSQLYVGVDGPRDSSAAAAAAATSKPPSSSHSSDSGISISSSSNNNSSSSKSRTSTSRSQQSIRKPLNAFLGELFVASWTDHDHQATTELFAEQVSHHPPITAMHVADRAHGVRADGYARVEMTFNGAVHIRQVGHATLRLDRFAEDYLVPLPDVRVRGFLSGCMYPEIVGTYQIVSSAGLVAELRFWGEGMLRGKRNSFEARMYRKGGEDDATAEIAKNRNNKQESIFEVAGVWSEGWTVRDGRTGEVIEEYRVDAPENEPVPMDLDPVEEQDPWESRRAWQGVLHGLRVGDMRMVVAEKTRIEQAQRQMRASEAVTGLTWEPLLFTARRAEEHDVFHRLAEGTGWQLHHDKTKGVWRVDEGRVKNLQRPFRAGLTPLGY